MLIFSQEENDKIDNIMTPVNSYAGESRTKFILGDTSLDQWDKYLKELEKMGDYPSILKMYNDKLRERDKK